MGSAGVVAVRFPVAGEGITVRVTAHCAVAGEGTMVRSAARCAFGAIPVVFGAAAPGTRYTTPSKSLRRSREAGKMSEATRAVCRAS